MGNLSPQLTREILNRTFQTDFAAFNRRAFEALESNSLESCWHHSAIAKVLEQVACGKIKRLLVTMPPRSLKSHMTSVAFTAWLHGLDPSLKLLCTSYNEDLAINFANGWRKLLGEPWYRAAFPKTVISRQKNREGETALTAGGQRLSLAAGGALTGRGADGIIVDDPLKASDAYSEAARQRVNDWFGQTLISRLNDKRSGFIVVVMQRLHINDLAGRLIETGEWHHLDLPAICRHEVEVPLTKDRVHRWQEGEPLQCKREPHSILSEIRASMSSQDFNSQYLQAPLSPEGNQIRLKDFRRLTKEQLERAAASRETCSAFYDSYLYSGSHTGQQALFLSLDTASSSATRADYSALQLWHLSGRTYDLLDQRRGQWDYPTLKAHAEQMSTANGKPRFLIEQTGVGFALIEELKQAGHNPIAIKPQGSKMERLARALPAIESGRVGLPQQADWLAEFEAEIALFPAARNDDQVDAMSQFILYADEDYKPPLNLGGLYGISIPKTASERFITSNWHHDEDD